MALLLQQIHPFVCSIADTYPIRNGANAKLGQKQSGHAIDHGCGVADSQRLAYDRIRNQSMHTFRKPEKNLAIWRSNEYLIEEGCYAILRQGPLLLLG